MSPSNKSLKAFPTFIALLQNLNSAGSPFLTNACDQFQPCWVFILASKQRNTNPQMLKAGVCFAVDAMFNARLHLASTSPVLLADSAAHDYVTRFQQAVPASVCSGAFGGRDDPDSDGAAGAL